jgi:DNA-directed RNA polymerase subunit RPC12/RpoP
MHEKIKISKLNTICDLCGGPIRKGETFRLVKYEYSSEVYREHIQCPTCNAKIVKPRKKSPKKANKVTPNFTVPLFV